MEENLNNEQVRPGDETQLMHVVFSSDDEMLAFYLTICRLVNPSSCLMLKTDKKMLEDLENTLQKNITAFKSVDNFRSIRVEEVVRGMGMHMMNTSISSATRLKYAESVSVLMDCVLNTTQNGNQFRQMSRMNALHIENVKYLLKKLKAKARAEEEKESGL